jgi:hypothetical protein
MGLPDTCGLASTSCLGCPSKNLKKKKWKIVDVGNVKSGFSPSSYLFVFLHDYFNVVTCSEGIRPSYSPRTEDIKELKQELF